MLAETECSYYGRLGGDKPIRTLSQDLLTDHEKGMFGAMREMEERIKRHITECKREVVKTILELTSKELKDDGCKSRKLK